jgi:hypothetical protein
MTQRNTKINFVFSKNKRLEADFSGGDLSSDGGLLLLRELDNELGLLKSLSNCILDPREAKKILHHQIELLRQRVFQICAGYEDANDSDHLRAEPVFKVSCNELNDLDKSLGSQPTITRLENRVDLSDIKRLRRMFVDQFISSFKVSPKEIVLDIDSYADETHGNQEQTCFHGFYNHYIYHPVLINDAKTGFPLLLQLRAGNSHSGKGIKSLLRWLFWRLQNAFPGTQIIMRGDGGFSLPEILTICDRSNVQYVFGYARNAVLERKIALLAEHARLDFVQKNKDVQLFDDVYYQSGGWDYPRRIVMKAELNSLGSNHRFVVTNMNQEASWIYSSFYVQRAETSENRIKELKLDIKADRLSCHRFIANQFRLILHQAAFVLMQKLKQLLSTTTLANSRIVTIREKLIKLAVRVRISARRIWIQFATSCPVKDLLVSLVPQLSDTG